MAATSPASASFSRSRRRERRRCASSAKSTSRRKPSSPPSKWMRTRRDLGSPAALRARRARSWGQERASAAVGMPVAPAVAVIDDAAGDAGGQTQKQQGKDKTTHKAIPLFVESPLRNGFWQRATRRASPPRQEAGNPV